MRKRRKRAAPKPRPTLQYKTSVDPAFTQAPSNPLAVTYAYDASAFSGTQNLAATGQLPAGVLNFYSAQTPGGPQSLYCSMNVGGSVTGGSCPITYSQTGTYAVTTEYIPNSASAVSQTEQETISPFTTSTALSVTPVTCPGPPPNMTPQSESCYSASATVSDQNGNSLSGAVHFLLGSQDAGAIPIGKACTLEVASDATSSEVFSPDCHTGSGFQPPYLQAYGPAGTAWTIAASFPGSPGWSASVSATEPLP